ncbi:pantoate--beta-alanine ligase [Bizionia myxarmorum]|uniref:Pantothenate synthetase n=1 Tax=Bizionia myxarmorum TaxID=291186 RepID=A0A5D0RB54_9FLAO|nr:pantoate--beta-alanine ligase [Bizionia myxarmorum]TYB78890.1 pantoate--beta-alanine ligase [Bizionia myxarmorum]
MTIFTEKKQIQNYLRELKDKQFRIGFVPTMGALHQGHLSLVAEALRQNDYVVVSIFVNPTQFDNAADLKNYPRTLERDTQLLETVSKNVIIYAPEVSDMYGDQTKAEHFCFDGLEFEMEGRFREGHFDGVGTIVKRLFEIVKPDHAYFGQKDFQQLAIVKKLVEKYGIPVIIHGCPILREANGLALSSRNERLKPEYKNAAPFIFKTLKSAKKQFGTKSAKYVTEWVENAFRNQDLLELEYFIIADENTLKPVSRKSKTKTYRAFIVVYADDIRLIDNIALN